MRKANIDLCFKAIDLEEPETNLDIMKRRWALIMRNVDINMGFRLIDREDVKYKGFKEDGNYYIAEQVLHSKRGMQRMLAALLRVPVERLEETRKMLYNKTEGENE